MSVSTLPQKSAIHWAVLGFIAGYHILLLVSLPLYLWFFTPSWQLIVITLLVMGATLISITMGYHRFYAHKTYRAKQALEVPLLFFGTAAIQGSALKWAYDHRLHHKFVDGEGDPYGTQKGFWHSHILWMLKADDGIEDRFVRDLLENPLVRLQHRHYALLATVANVLLVLLAAAITGDLLGAFVFVFLLRLFLSHHSTWFINSLAHIWGSKPYSTEHSAVNNFILALLTYGEGYHNYHHTFSGDYRNGVRWYQFDPPKYFIWLASKLGLASDLQRVNRVAIHKKLVAADRKLMLEHLKNVELMTVSEMVTRMEQTYESLTEKLSRMKTDLDRYRALKQDQAREEMKVVKARIREMRRNIREDMREWEAICKHVLRQPSLA